MRFPICLITAVLLPLLFGSCSEEEKQKPVKHRPGSPVSDSVPEKVEEEGVSEHHNGIGYTFQLIGAEEFVSRKGETIAEADRKALSEESVLIVDFAAADNKDVFSDSRITMDGDAALQYLVGDIAADISIEQGGKTFEPEGSHYEKGLSGMGQLRSFVYFRGVDPSKPAKVVYYDRLFGAGFMRITVNKVQKFN
jgi:hypothetical protein